MGESLAERQNRKLGPVDAEKAKLFDNTEKPIVRPVPQVEIQCLPIKGLTPSYQEAVKKTYTNNKKKGRKKK